ncbi:hypothetical protein [Flagellimonas meridianipacifica]|uniref:Uncharacterized protein n=1 Tax=Flagellimonas meridianipacifica TaxID=1080225 RepID=A0A2T0MIK9_9FLAO|nr:hypothetical protein [Allomuricauda pacifica]PRX57422.1 hypothetical protein CLV81_1426 [Allomuricauda pacifica]
MKKLNLLTLSIVFMLMHSCQKEEPSINVVADNPKTYVEDTGKKMVLGKKLENPYSVTNMRRALIKLQEVSPGLDKKYKGLTFKDSTDIQTTDVYVKFWIEDDEQQKLLLADSLNLSNTPMDMEILEEGDYLPAEDTVNVESKWAYTSVPVDYKFHPEVKYEKIEDLFLPEPAHIEEEEEDEEETTTVGGKTKVSKQFLFDLEDEALRLTGNYETPEDDQYNNSPTERRKRRPQGYVKVKNTVTGRMDPVVGVKIKTRRWFKWAKGWTNSQGYYSVNRRYRRPVRYTVVFKNTRGFKVWRSVVTISSARYRAGRRSNKGHNMNFYTNNRAWSWATVNNATVKYLNYCTKFGVGKPHSNLRIVALGGTGPSAAPMLRRVWGIYGFTSRSKVKNFLAKANGISISLNTLAHMLKFIQPDLIIRAGASKGTGRVFETTFHELAHASHFKKVGSSYWIKYINYIITYGTFNSGRRPYGDGHGHNHGVCALGEAWAYHLGYDFTIKEFGINQAPFPLNSFENFDPLKKPNNLNIDRYRNNSGWTGWIPGGIIQDITDNKRDLVRLGYYDDVSGYSIKNVYDALDSGIESPQKFRDRLLIENGNRDANDLKKLFEAYYWK